MRSPMTSIVTLVTVGAAVALVACRHERQADRRDTSVSAPLMIDSLIQRSGQQPSVATNGAVTVETSANAPGGRQPPQRDRGNGAPVGPGGGASDPRTTPASSTTGPTTSRGTDVASKPGAAHTDPSSRTTPNSGRQTPPAPGVSDSSAHAGTSGAPGVSDTASRAGAGGAPGTRDSARAPSRRRVVPATTVRAAGGTKVTTPLLAPPARPRAAVPPR
jgi:hypothetical protein